MERLAYTWAKLRVAALHPIWWHVTQAYDCALQDLIELRQRRIAAKNA